MIHHIYMGYIYPKYMPVVSPVANTDTRDITGFVIRGRDSWIQPVNQLLGLKGLNHLSWDGVRAIALGQYLRNASISQGRCGVAHRVPSGWLFAAPAVGTPLNTSATSLLFGMYHAATFGRMDDPSTWDGWGYGDLMRLRYMFQGNYSDGGPFVGCAVQVGCMAVCSGGHRIQASHEGVVAKSYVNVFVYRILTIASGVQCELCTALLPGPGAACSLG